MLKPVNWMLAAVLTLSLTVPALALERGPFPDVPPDHWATEAIAQAKEENVIKGMGNGLYAPDDPLTAAQFSTIVTGAFYWRILNDIELEEDWNARYQKAAETAGLMENVGVENWGAPMTRYQMAQMLYNITKDKGIQPDGAASAGLIADWNDIPEMYQEAVSASYTMEMLSGMEDGTFAGDQFLTRAQAAVVFVKLDQALEVKNGLMEWGLEKEERLLAKAGLAYEFTRYPGKNGTVYVAYQFGTSHGTACHMEYVTRDGDRLNIIDLLPATFYGAFYYAKPTDIQFDKAGEKLAFITPIREEDAVTFEVKDWGDTLCIVDLTTGTIEFREPLQSE